MTPQEKYLARIRAEQEKLEKEDRERRLAQMAAEAEVNHRQEMMADTERQIQALEHKQVEQAYMAEMAKKVLKDAEIVSGSADNILPNPLTRFFQHTPK
jgi:hypothetical protein